MKADCSGAVSKKKQYDTKEKLDYFCANYLL